MSVSELREVDAPQRWAMPTAALPEGLEADRADWLRRYAGALVALDALILVVSGLVAALARFGTSLSQHDVRGVPYLFGSLLLLPIWTAALTLSRCYETRFLGNGAEEFRRVANAATRVAFAVVSLAYLTKTDVARGFFAIAIPLSLCGVVAGRLGARAWLHRQRRRGHCTHKVVVVGPAEAALEMTMRLQREPLSGLQVVAACVIGDPARYAADTLVPVLGTLADVVPVLEELRADTVCVAAGPGVTSEALRQLSYELEGSGVDLLVSPVLTNVTGNRLHRRSMPGLPLLHVDEPELRGSRHFVKTLFDRVLGTALLLVAGPLLLAVAVAIKATSRGPVFFRHERVGRDGTTFSMWKFRSMYADAEARKAALAHLSTNTVYFKVQDDPRITPLGRVLRRFSIDELPQLLNVVRGEMSLVGPRPQVQSEVDAYTGHLHRRLLMKPGMTGLWQVSGRNDLDFDDSVRLDLHYVENWSLGLDIAIMCRTVLAVLRPSGAY